MVSPYPNLYVFYIDYTLPITISNGLTLATSHEFLFAITMTTTGGTLGREEGNLQPLDDVDLHHLLTLLQAGENLRARNKNHLVISIWIVNSLSKLLHTSSNLPKPHQ